MTQNTRQQSHTVEVLHEDGTPMLEKDGTPVSFELSDEQFQWISTQATEKGLSIEKALANTIEEAISLLSEEARSNR